MRAFFQRLKYKKTISIISFFVVVIAGYYILSQITTHPLDKTVIVAPPVSPKSAPERYAFGYQPAFSYTEERAQCAEQYPTKKAFFGDLHVHTALSADAYPDGTRVYPKDAYRFAKGEAIPLPVRDGEAEKMLQLVQPLDFVSVTDHSDTLGEGYICRTPGAFAGYDSKACQKFRAGGEAGVRVLMSSAARLKPTRNQDVCGPDNRDCEAADKIVWQSLIAAAEEADDKSAACEFTAFIGYEYTRSTNAMHLHRNTIFRNAQVPDKPATVFNHRRVHDLLTHYETACREGIEACDVISIPHNSNISSGNTFNPRELDGFSDDSQQAFRLMRQRYDRLMEITQHKGASECVNRATDILGDVDELCDIEALRQFGREAVAIDFTGYTPLYYKTESEECGPEHFDESTNLYKGFCLSSRDFARGALLEGLVEKTEYGENPFEFGFIGSTDTHLGIPGYTDEKNWQGHIAYETDLKGRLGESALGRYNRLISNPGGLAGVYASERSRDAIFHGMKRREAFATSGPRIEPRFFVGHFPANMCQRGDALEIAYQNGTPMGSSLPAQTAPFSFWLEAKADPRSNPLQKLQLIKGYIDAQGQKHNKVIDVVEQESTRLCSLYTDVEYEPSQPSYYYLRVVETASPRWSAYQCGGLPEAERPEECADLLNQETIEMAWSSPIWFTPEAAPQMPAKILDQMTGHQHQEKIGK